MAGSDSAWPSVSLVPWYYGDRRRRIGYKPDMSTIAEDREWLETDGLGGYAMGTAALLRTRRYHALLTAARHPPADRVVLVAAVDVWLQLGGQWIPLCAHRFRDHERDVVEPQGRRQLSSFTIEPWPTWTFTLPGAGTVTFSLFVPHGHCAVVLEWRGDDLPADAQLVVRPLLAGRDHHALQRENPGCSLTGAGDAQQIVCQTYPAVPAVITRSNGHYTADPQWWRGFVYTEERARGYDWIEDLPSPGVFRFAVGAGPAVLLFAAAGVGEALPEGPAPVVARALGARERQRRAAFPTPLQRAADQYLVRRGDGHSIIAGYPWFADWGRDTFLSMRGLLLATGRLRDAHGVLRAWLPHLRGGMLPNRFPDGSGPPDYNSVDAALWFAVAAHELLQCTAGGDVLSAHDRARLQQGILQVANGYQRGALHGIRADDDGLLRCGVPGTQLTWMDAKAGGRVVTPRIGKPVEIQALWLNTLHAAAAIDSRFKPAVDRARHAIGDRFWNPQRNCLFDVVDDEHEHGAVDAAVRPNQILAVGGLPVAALQGVRARAVVDTVERLLWTPAGLRTLAPDDPAYEGHYAGDAVARDLAYHQGTAWPWLAGPFVEAWIAVHGGGGDVRDEARRRFVAPLRAMLHSQGLGHISEVADGDPPHRPGGAPFQAWSLAELLRIEALLCEQSAPAASDPTPAPAPRR